MEDETAMSGSPRRSIGSALARAIVAVVAVLALGPVASAMAAGPEVKITSPSPGSSVRNQTPPISGTTSDVVPLDQVTVTIFPGTKAEGTPAQPAMTATPSLEGFWSVTPAPALADGTYTALATQTDSLTMEAGSSTVTFTVDTTPPEVSVDPVPSPTNNRTPTLEGRAGSAEGDERSVTVVVYLGEPGEGNVAASGEGIPVTGGTWSYTPSSNLADGTYTVQAIQRDEAGNQGVSAPVMFRVDTTPPEVSVDPVSSPTSNRTPTLEGHAGTAEGDEQAVTVVIYAGEPSEGNVVASREGIPVSGGTWSYTPSSNLADGTYTVQAKQRDTAGNRGVSAPVRFTVNTKPVDTTPPEVSIDPVASPTKDSTPTVRGHGGTAEGDSSTVVVKVYRGNSTSGSVASEGGVTVNEGAWSYTPSHLADGIYTAQATQSDAAGNQGVSKPPITFTVDTTPPKVSIDAVPSPTKDSTPTLEGHAGSAEGDEQAVTVVIYAGEPGEGNVVASREGIPVSGGAWSYTPSSNLADGTYTAQAIQRDTARNRGVSASVRFRVDTRPPSVDLATPTGGSYLSTQQPTFSGRAGNEAGDGAVTLRIYAGGSTSGDPVQTEEIARSGGSWTTGSEGPRLTDGTYTAQATQSDAAGNTGSSAPRTFTIKTDSPVVKLNSPGHVIPSSTPSFTGSAATATGDSRSVTLTVYRGESTTGKNVAESLTAPLEDSGTWISGPTRQHLPDGTYIAQAEQRDAAGHAGVSAGSIFTIDTTPPQVTLTTPVTGSMISGESEAVGGAAGTATGDLPTVTIQLFAGAAVGTGEPLESVTVNASKGPWSATLGGLGGGTYTVRATQRDQAGNLGVSGASTFTVTSSGGGGSPPHTPSPPVGDLPPAASFTFFPTAPRVGESVSLASSSTDPTSPIVAYAWDLAGGGVFQPRGPVIVTSFATPGSHVVHLRVTAADGLSSVVAQTIQVAARRLPLMQPFPIVRIVGSDTHAGARLSLLSAQVPVGARVSVRCRGRGCPVKVESHVATLSRHRGGAGTVAIAFRRFERSLRAGVSLEIRVSKPGEIGKYTRFGIRRNKPPVRVDACLDPTRGTPIVCPSS